MQRMSSPAATRTSSRTARLRIIACRSKWDEEPRGERLRLAISDMRGLPLSIHILPQTRRRPCLLHTSPRSCTFQHHRTRFWQIPCQLALQARPVRSHTSSGAHVSRCRYKRKITGFKKSIAPHSFPFLPPAASQPTCAIIFDSTDGTSPVVVPLILAPRSRRCLRLSSDVPAGAVCPTIVNRGCKCLHSRGANRKSTVPFCPPVHQYLLA